MPLRLILTLLVFAATMLLVFVRPRQWPEAIWSCLGGAALVALGYVSLADVAHLVWQAADALLFLAALLLFSALLERSGFFDWTAIVAARRAGGRVRTLYRNVFVLGTLITTVLSLDTTAVILTPIVLAFIRRLELPGRPFIFACAFIANVASLSLPVSNLTNLLLVSTFPVSFAGFAARMLLPTVVAVVVNYWLFRALFRAQLPDRFDDSRLPSPESVIPDRGYFRCAMAVLGAVSIGYFVAPLVGARPYQVLFAGCAILLVAGLRARRVDVAMVRHIQWSLFPFVVGLFAVVRAVEDLGAGELATRLLARLPSQPLLAVPLSAGVAGLVSNVVNNLPAAMLARDVFQGGHAPQAALYGTLIGTNIGPNVVVVGSLATMLVLGRARAAGDTPSNLDLLGVGLRVTPLILLAASLAMGLILML